MPDAPVRERGGRGPLQRGLDSSGQMHMGLLRLARRHPVGGVYLESVRQVDAGAQEATRSAERSEEGIGPSHGPSRGLELGEVRERWRDVVPPHPPVGAAGSAPQG